VLLFFLANLSGSAHLLVQVDLHLPLLDFSVLDERNLSLILVHLHDAGPVRGQHISLLVLNVTESIGNLLQNRVILSMLIFLFAWNILSSFWAWILMQGKPSNRTTRSHSRF
jgi:hypothetical protein